jgi:hypothetical protein
MIDTELPRTYRVRFSLQPDGGRPAVIEVVLCAGAFANDAYEILSWNDHPLRGG